MLHEGREARFVISIVAAKRFVPQNS